MKPARVCLHGLVMCIANVAGVVGGFVVYRASGLRTQLAVQAPVAAALSVGLFAAWVFFVRGLPPKPWSDEPAERLGTFIASLIWNPLLFVPLHYTTQGYLSAMSNVVALMVFQVPVNASSLLLVTTRSAAAHPPGNGEHSSA